MRHAVKGRKLGRTSSHREALFRNQLQSLVLNERIVTTLPKAKELRPIAEKVITRGKHGSLHDRRWVLAWVLRRELVKKVFDEIAPRFQERPGGYLRIVKLGPRQGDGAEMAVLELVERQDAAPAEAPPKSSAKKAPRPKKDEASKEAKPKKETKPKKEAKEPKKESRPKRETKEGGKAATSARKGRAQTSAPKKTG
ncbi:50S ribosomal protein L17 [bacterium]|nr:MAG: 50S ribosomal protein L17 [bacterium]